MLACAAACAKKPAHWIDRIEVEGDTVENNSVLTLTPSAIQKLLVDKLTAQGSFHFTSNEKPPADAVPLRLSLSLEFTRESKKEGREGTWAEVGATLSIKPKSEELIRYDINGLGEVPVTGESLDERQNAVRRALGAALDQIVDATHLQLLAAAKKDDELIADLKSKDARVREFAVRVLADRGNPAVADALLDKLKGDDPDDVRRAIGGLIELKDPRAVPALIDLARAKDMVFLREIIFALGQIGGEEAEAYLYTVAQGHDQPAIRAAAQQALDELSARKARTEKPKENSK